jgi:hypothetical protein
VKNELTYQDFERETLRLYGEGYTRISFRLVMDRIRFTRKIGCSNNIGPEWTRRFHEDHPTLNGLFETHRLKEAS